MPANIEASLERLAQWVERHEYRAYDPGDGQLSFLRFVTFNRPFARRLLTAMVLRTAFNIRPWIGIKPHVSTKGMGYMAWGCLRRYSLSGEARFKNKAEFCLNWLIEHRAPKYDEYCWGNEFAFTTRGGTIPAHEPTIVWSSLIGQAFLEAYRALGESKYLEIASSTSRWVAALPLENTANGSCLSYVAFKQSSIHNSNMLGAALLGQVSQIRGDQEGLNLARAAMTYSCSRQNADGSWFYGEDPKYHWIDNFHTGYNLDCLKRYIEATGDRSFEENLERGFAYFKNTFFEPDGRPRYYHYAVYPTDIQCASQAIDTLCYFCDRDPQALDLAKKVAAWTIEHMQAPDGHFYYRDLGWKKIKIPMFHWGQATMFKALAHLLSKMKARTASVESTPVLLA